MHERASDWEVRMGLLTVDPTGPTQLFNLRTQGKNRWDSNTRNGTKPKRFIHDNFNGIITLVFLQLIIIRLIIFPLYYK